MKEKISKKKIPKNPRNQKAVYPIKSKVVLILERSRKSIGIRRQDGSSFGCCVSFR